MEQRKLTYTSCSGFQFTFEECCGVCARLHERSGERSTVGVGLLGDLNLRSRGARHTRYQMPSIEQQSSNNAKKLSG